MCSCLKARQVKFAFELAEDETLPAPQTRTLYTSKDICHSGVKLPAPRPPFTLFIVCIAGMAIGIGIPC